MSRYGFCERGGMDGIKVTDAELRKFAKSINKKFIDEFIPLSDIKDQKSLINNCPHDHDKVISQYWESTSGSHGFCCPTCGEVIQWG